MRDTLKDQTEGGLISSLDRHLCQVPCCWGWFSGPVPGAIMQSSLVITLTVAWGLGLSGQQTDPGLGAGTAEGNCHRCCGQEGLFPAAIPGGPPRAGDLGPRNQGTWAVTSGPTSPPQGDLVSGRSSMPMLLGEGCTWQYPWKMLFQGGSGENPLSLASPNARRSWEPKPAGLCTPCEIGNLPGWTTPVLPDSVCCPLGTPRPHLRSAGRRLGPRGCA